MALGTYPLGSTPLGSPGGPNSYAMSVGESVAFADPRSVLVNSFLSSGFSLGDAMAVSHTWAIIESLAMADAASPNIRWLGYVNDTLQMGERLRLIAAALVAEGITFTDTANQTLVRAVAVIESIMLADSSIELRRALALVADALVVADAARSIQLGQVAESLATLDSLEARARYFEQVVVNAVFADATVPLGIFTVRLADGFELDDDAAPRVLWKAIIEERLDFSIALVIGGVPYRALSMNAATRAVTEYANYPFNSFAHFAGRYFGAADLGLFELSGSTDNGTPIDAKLRTGLLRVANGKLARVDSVYLGYRADGSMQLKVTVAGAAGEKLGYVYDLDLPQGGTTRPGRFKIGRGLKAAYWAFELANTGGADFALDVVEIHPLVLDRRIP